MNPTVGRILSVLVLLLLSVGVVGGFIVWTVKKAEDPVKLIVKWCISLPLIVLCLFAVRWFGLQGPMVIAFIGVILSIIWTPHIAASVFKPVTSLYDGGDEPPEQHPFYSVARAKQKRGEYLEAAALIRGQLDRFPRDVEGNLLLAEVQAENLKDLEGAELTIQRFCEQPGHAPPNLAFALYSLADWHLQIGRDRDAAQRALEKIMELLPDTEFALGAAQRIAHLGTSEMLLAPEMRKKFLVKEGVHNLGLVKARERPKPVEGDPAEMAAEYARHLEQHPLDTEARENLAILYADHYKRLDLATEELEQMISHPSQPSRLVVHWLNLLADLQIRCGVDYETVRQTLQRIVDREPNLAAAEIARKRLALLKLEFKANEEKPAIKMGHYEQNIGLKRGQTRLKQ